MTAQVDNAPAGLVPVFTWEMNVSGWFTVRTAPEFSYAGNRDEAWDYRVTVTYPNGDTATSDPLTVAWLTDQARNGLTQDDEITAQDNGDGVQGQQSTGTVLVSNIDGDSLGNSNAFTAQGFTTGDTEATLTEVRVNFTNSDWVNRCRSRSERTRGPAALDERLDQLPGLRHRRRRTGGNAGRIPADLSGAQAMKEFTASEWAPTSSWMPTTTYWIMRPRGHHGLCRRPDVEYGRSLSTFTGEPTNWSAWRISCGGGQRVRPLGVHRSNPRMRIRRSSGSVKSTDPSTKVTSERRTRPR